MDKTRDTAAADSAPPAVDFGGRLGEFIHDADSAPAIPGQVSRNWRDRINYAGRRTRVAQLQRRQGDEPQA